MVVGAQYEVIHEILNLMGLIYLKLLIFTKENQGPDLPNVNMVFSSNKITNQIFAIREAHWTEPLFPHFVLYFLPGAPVPVFIKTSYVEKVSFHWNGCHGI